MRKRDVSSVCFVRAAWPKIEDFIRHLASVCLRPSIGSASYAARSSGGRAKDGQRVETSPLFSVTLSWTFALNGRGRLFSSGFRSDLLGSGSILIMVSSLLGQGRRLT